MELEVALMIFYFPDFEKVERHSRMPTSSSICGSATYSQLFIFLWTEVCKFYRQMLQRGVTFVASSFLCAQDFRPGIFGIS